jgi:hypothetical protein
MTPFHSGKNPQDIARIVSQYVQAMTGLLFWLTVAAASLAATYVAARTIIVAVRVTLKALGA